MPIRVEAYTAAGIATGVVALAGPLRGALDAGPEASLVIEQASWQPLDGSPPAATGELRLAVDDLLLVMVDEPDTAPVNAAWHRVELDAGPYQVSGEMPTVPGFDPGRALARPGGEFVVLRDARIRLRGDEGEAAAPCLLVNRYTVDRVEADLMLGFFFPGAEIAITGAASADAPLTWNALG